MTENQEKGNFLTHFMEDLKEGKTKVKISLYIFIACLIWLL